MIIQSKSNARGPPRWSHPSLKDNCPGEGVTVKNLSYPPYIPMLSIRSCNTVLILFLVVLSFEPLTNFSVGVRASKLAAQVEKDS